MDTSEWDDEDDDEEEEEEDEDDEEMEEDLWEEALSDQIRVLLQDCLELSDTTIAVESSWECAGQVEFNIEIIGITVADHPTIRAVLQNADIFEGFDDDEDSDGEYEDDENDEQWHSSDDEDEEGYL